MNHKYHTYMFDVPGVSPEKWNDILSKREDQPATFDELYDTETQTVYDTFLGGFGLDVNHYIGLLSHEFGVPADTIRVRIQSR